MLVFTLAQGIYISRHVAPQAEEAESPKGTS